MDALTTDRPSFLAEQVMRIGADGKPHLIGGACTACGLKMFPHALVCPGCMEESIASEEMPDAGTLYAFTIVHVGRPPWNKVTALGYVDLPNGVRVFAHLRGELSIGSPVRLSTDVVGRSSEGQPLHNFVYIVRDTL